MNKKIAKLLEIGLRVAIVFIFIGCFIGGMIWTAVNLGPIGFGIVCIIFIYIYTVTLVAYLNGVFDEKN